MLEANWIAVQCYQVCEWTCVGVGMGGLLWTGISAREIESALRALAVPDADRLDTVHRIRVMVAAARPLRNRQRD